MAAATQLTALPNLSSPQGKLHPTPTTIASAATVVPTTRLTFITGTVQIATVTAPIEGHHELVFVFTNAAPGAFLTTGNIQRVAQPVQNVPVLLEYDPSTKLYWVGKV